MAQSKQIKNMDYYISKVLERASYIEQQHVDNIADKIKSLGKTPTSLGDVIAPILGKMSGNLVARTGLITMLKVNIMLEKKAMDDYKNLIMKIKEDDLFTLLWSNLIDEDLHTSWFSSKVQELEKGLYK
ncbi:MAG: cytochrome B [Clostridiaceae bacterium BRH_c20a]|nr:MAG: cytochrome B [Clostridiaceae bacterium BRH_c20a]